MSDDPTSRVLRRSGFWRRAAAFLTDLAVVLLPLQVVVSVLFALTHGMIQGRFGISTTACTPLTELPPGLKTRIADPTRIVDCRTSLFGFDTSRFLHVDRSQTDGAVTTGVFERIRLDAEGQFMDPAGFDVSWIAGLVLLVYLVGMEASRGQTVGKRLLGIRTIVRSRGGTIGIGVLRALARRLAMMLGAIATLPALAMVFWSDGSIEGMSRLVHDRTYWAASTGGAVVVMAWFVWIAVSMARKRDPVYDRIVGTAVVRASP
jgi:uncharacterized RDD family membrane protein YckC